MAEEEERAVVVLGMHRSGTSLVTRTLSELGVHLGGPLMPAHPDNPQGYWEHQQIVELHDELLAAVGSRWDDVRPLPEAWLSSRKIQSVLHRLRALVQADFLPHQLWGFKDPRTCRLVPLWEQIFGEMGVAATYVMVIRDPRGVAGSLARRDGFSQAKSHLLWLQSVLEAELQTRDRERVWVFLDQFVEDNQRTLSELARGLNIPLRAGLDLQLRPPGAMLEVKGHPSARLSQRAYTLLRTYAKESDPALLEGLTDIRQQFCQASALLSYPESDDLRAEIVNNEVAFNFQYAQLEDAYRQLEDAYRPLEDAYRQLEVAYRQLEGRYQELRTQPGKLLHALLKVVWKKLGRPPYRGSDHSPGASV